MQQIIYFFIRNKNFLLFLFLFVISLFFTIQSHTYHSGKFVTSANFLTGGIYSFESSISEYFGLEKQNLKLVEENKRLRTQLSLLSENATAKVEDSSFLNSRFRFRTAKVINNTYSKSKNYLTINRGKRDSISIDMGVISPKGIIGIVNATSGNYATVLSILNTESQINARLKKSNHFGSLVWNTEDPNVAQLIDIPRLAPVVIGDTVVTGGRSTIFPEGVLIGTIKDYNLEEGSNYYDLDIELFNDMTNLRHVYVIENLDADEILELENAVDDVEQ